MGERSTELLDCVGADKHCSSWSLEHHSLLIPPRSGRILRVCSLPTAVVRRNWSFVAAARLYSRLQGER